ncbi:hypothetical protein AX767_14985 [Variovorax sp. PAMC 28711]|nr:hypothetical protein AX767_14985 [Variovorax sp. PAMC 28711]
MNGSRPEVEQSLDFPVVRRDADLGLTGIRNRIAALTKGFGKVLPPPSALSTPGRSASARM